MRHFILFFAILYIQPRFTNGQHNQLQEYITLGIKNNTTINEATLQFEASVENLNQTRGQLLPTVDFGTRYTRAFGGRAVEFPLGDLMNPVYSTLNGLTGEDQFPQIENQSFNFNRTTDIETKLSLSQPVLDRRLSFQKKIAEEQAKMSNVDISIAKRSLVAQIKSAYFNYLKTEKLLDVFQISRDLVEENLRVSERLYENDKVTVDAVLRARTELSNIELQIAEAEKLVNNSRAYFNFLLNRPLETEIIAEEMIQLPTPSTTMSDDLLKREEFTKLKLGMAANKHEHKLYASNNLPNIYAVADYGFQGTEYVFNNESDYALASLVLSWNLFSGFQNKSMKQKVRIQRKILESQQQSLSNNIALESTQALYDMKEKLQKYNATQNMEQEAKTSFELVQKKYKEGMATQVELLDARTNYTNASLQNIISKYDIWISHAELERVTASYPIDNI